MSPAPAQRLRYIKERSAEARTAPQDARCAISSPLIKSDNHFWGIKPISLELPNSVYLLRSSDAQRDGISQKSTLRRIRQKSTLRAAATLRSLPRRDKAARRPLAGHVERTLGGVGVGQQNKTRSEATSRSPKHWAESVNQSFSLLFPILFPFFSQSWTP